MAFLLQDLEGLLKLKFTSLYLIKSIKSSKRGGKKGEEREIRKKLDQNQNESYKNLN